MILRIIPGVEAALGMTWYRRSKWSLWRMNIAETRSGNREE